MIGIIKGICQNNNIDELFAKKIADNFLFLVQKKSGCYFFFKVLPELFNILDKKYEIICDHQEIGEDCSEPQFRIGGKKKDKNNELHIEFHSEDLSEFEMNTINKNLDESTK